MPFSASTFIDEQTYNKITPVIVTTLKGGEMISPVRVVNAGNGWTV